MKTEQVISVDDFCVYHNVEYTFIDYLADAGLVKVTRVNKAKCIPLDEIQKLERMVRLHTQLEINEAGVATINNLLHKLEDMRQEMSALRSRLRLYEH
ncbi:MerR family transcriptional regulator [Mucilaginibacter achroorhodeus]|uniref:MerR family transcriptional regulator n=1 Tax=Mucilaginibacter achroorhodeus TaxID=2599294 RepID=A0A563TWS1_9SPHI|nr:chaperone modulator CbpM [Mucilaginibacter achroorhodeus]TWR23795.1 MerR family transcriptional regulator [Mucilaginibacter achroorhodeus]